jgi:hypothetical protein
MKKCKYCEAEWRVNYPFGRKSTARITFDIPHHKKCRFAPKIK